MMLPNAERAILGIRKLREYTLNPGHLAGGNKARVFASCLGIGQQDAELPRSAYLRAMRPSRRWSTGRWRHLSIGGCSMHEALLSPSWPLMTIPCRPKNQARTSSWSSAFANAWRSAWLMAAGPPVRTPESRSCSIMSRIRRRSWMVSGE